MATATVTTETRGGFLFSEAVLATVPSTDPRRQAEGVRYEIRLPAAGTLCCTCPAYRFHGMKKPVNERSCKHLDAFCQALVGPFARSS